MTTSRGLRIRRAQASAWGEIKTMVEWAKDERCVVTYATLKSRLNRGWIAELAITTPAQKGNLALNGLKLCPRCGETKRTTEFYAHHRLSDGLQTYCKSCAYLYRIASHYNLSAEQYLAMAELGCDICGSQEDLHVDHDHACCPGSKSCGECIRGLLCGGHNRGIGHFNNNIKELLLAVDYLKRFHERTSGPTKTQRTLHSEDRGKRR